MYSGKLASLSSVALGDMAQGEAHRYRFSVSLPADADDTYQGASSAVTFCGRPRRPSPPSTPTPTPPPSTAAGTGTTTPARATTAEAPPKATTAGGTVKLGATFTARARQKATRGKVSRHRHLCRHVPDLRERDRRLRVAQGQAEAGQAHADEGQAPEGHADAPAGRGWRWPPGAP